MLTRCPLQQPAIAGELRPMVIDPDLSPERDMLVISEKAWAEAKRRVPTIAPLAAADLVPAVAARAAGKTLGLSERTIYALVRRYRRSGSLLSSLAPRSSPGGRGEARLAGTAERIIAEAIQDEYLTRQKKRVAAVIRAVRERAKAAGISPPAPNTVRARVRAVKVELAARRREGARSAALRRLEPVTGMTPPAERPMAVLQIDHTPFDLILVDEAYRKPIGRPWLTVAIDVMSRCIAGFLISFDPASAGRSLTVIFPAAPRPDGTATAAPSAAAARRGAVIMDPAPGRGLRIGSAPFHQGRARAVATDQVPRRPRRSAV